jgi:hypothetical protein
MCFDVGVPHSKDAAEAVLAAHMDALGTLFPTAWDQWEAFGEALPEQRMQCCVRTRASMISNFAATTARTVFEGKAPAVALHDGRKFLLIEFDSQLCVRLNKFLSGTRHMGGISTRQRQAFAAQEPLTGLPESTNLVLGYEVNRDGTQIASMAISCSTHGRLNWEIDVPLPGQAVVLAPPMPDSAPSAPTLISTRREREEAKDGTNQ